MTKTDIERMLEDPELHPDFRKDLELQLSEIINNENFEKLNGIKIDHQVEKVNLELKQFGMIIS